ncbi:hypothetical protein CIK05_15730 [Bdellovibrio sp. qaytius]|nr:hypothetical protein CIK05_15730 [Bdellovibrio sp. qaytius]
MQKNMDRLILSDQKQKTCRALAIIFVFFLTAHFPTNVSAQAANTQPQKLSGHFLISTTKLKQTLENLIVQKKPIVGVYEKPIPISSLVPIAVSNIEYNFDWQSVNFNPIQNNNIQFALVAPKIEITVPKLAIDTVLVKEVNGVILRVNVKSNCESIKVVTNSEAFTIQAAIAGSAKADHVDMTANVTDINLGTPKLTVQNFKCDNIAGLEDLVADEILQQFSKIDFYKPVLLDKINTLLVKQMEKYSAKAEKAIKDQILTIEALSAPQFSLLQVNQKFIDIGFALNNPDVAYSPVENYNMNSDGVMIVDKSEMQEFMKQGIAAKLSKLSYSSKTISELDKLTKSRFKQFFVWPALMKIPSGQELILRPALESLDITIKPDSYVSQINLKATAGIWVMERNEAMVYLRTNMQAVSNVADAAKVQTSISSLATTAVWDAGYVNRHNCSERISTSIVDTTAKKFFNDNWATANLSVLKLTDTASAQLQKIYYGKDNKLYFELGLNN